jgi:hypothetical protein
MFSTISWIDYIIAVTILLIVYYLFIVARYYPSELKELFSGKRKLNFRRAPMNEFSTEEKFLTEKDAPDHPKNEDEANAERLAVHLSQVISYASKRELAPGELKQHLQLILREFPEFKDTALQSSINNLIISECEKQGVAALREEEVEMLWNDNV